jgi:uncharacterized iron-regulated membrane protein
MFSTKSLLKAFRLLHLYLGVFTTPAIIFFAFTGFLQTFSLHETTRGSDYKPPKILVQLGELHKRQTLAVPEKKAQPPAFTKLAMDTPAAQPIPRPVDTPAASNQNLWPMKIFFAIVSVSLLLSTFTGVYMAYKYIRNKQLVTASLIAGIAIPILLLFVA